MVEPTKEQIEASPKDIDKAVNDHNIKIVKATQKAVKQGGKS